MLNEKEKAIIKETVPVLQERGVEITSFFYNRMFTQHPELKNMFNQTNQKKGLQSTALAQSVLAAAMNIDDLTRILPVVKEIAFKHCALQVPPAGYDIVGENLLAAIQNVLKLSDDDAILDTWAKAYGEIAKVFIEVEKDIYKTMAWDGFQAFVIKNIETVATDIKAFTVKSDEIDMSKFKPGQYVTVDVKSASLPYRAKRHYSIVEGDSETLTFAVKHDVTTTHEGEVSTILHSEYKEGDTIQLSAPVGPFSVVNSESPQLFIGSGIGVTPLIPMFNQVAKSEAPIQFIQNIINDTDIPFSNKLEAIAESKENNDYIIYDKHKMGYMDASYLNQFITKDTEVYVCGGVNFLQSIITTLKEMEVDETKIHFESFIPKLSVGV